MIQEYQSGDRIRTLIANEGIPAGTKGNVIYSDDGGSVVEAKVEGNEVQANFANNELEMVRQASHGGIETARALQGINFAGLNLPEELIEAQGHIADLVDNGYSYRYIENYMASLGYGYNVIRKAFTVFSGMTPEDAVGYDSIWSPGCIPQFTYAWGEAKKGKGYYFIMSIAGKYCIFHQIDDMNREEDSGHMTLMEAKDDLKKLVKKVMQWDPPVKEIKKEKIDKTQLYKEPALFMNAGEVQEWGRKLSVYSSKNERGAMIRQAFVDGLIDEPMRDGLLSIYGDAEAEMEEGAVREKLNDIEQEKMGRPIRDELSEKTPAQFFQKNKLQHRYSMLPADTIDAISRYIYQANSQLSEFEVNIYSLKYSTVQPAKKRNKGTPVSTEPDLMDATASVSVLLEITDTKSASPYGTKLGLMVFSVVGSEVCSSDVLKGEDDYSYALTTEGLRKMFATERAMTETKK